MSTFPTPYPFDAYACAQYRLPPRPSPCWLPVVYSAPVQGSCCTSRTCRCPQPPLQELLRQRGYLRPKK